MLSESEFRDRVATADWGDVVHEGFYPDHFQVKAFGAFLEIWQAKIDEYVGRLYVGRNMLHNAEQLIESYQRGLAAGYQLAAKQLSNSAENRMFGDGQTHDSGADFGARYERFGNGQANE